MRAAHSVYQPNKIVMGNGDDVEVLADGQRDAAPNYKKRICIFSDTQN
jgi:hypothetical protein